MSFAYDVKAELCKVPINRSCCAVAEGCGVLLYASAFTANEVRIVTENDEFAARLPKLFQKAFSLRFDELPDKSKDGGKLVFRITQEDKLDTIWRALGYDRRAHFALHLNFALLEEECCRASFLRGAFLSGGSVTDPQKRYHLELATSHVQAGREVEALLRDMGFEPKNVMRQNNLITYFKSSTHIEDLLTLIGAPGRALEIMSAKIEKEMRNTVNRRVNCDAANLDKAVLASREQVEAFTRLTESGAINDLPVKLQEVAVARLLQPELTLSELAATFDPPPTKAGGLDDEPTVSGWGAHFRPAADEVVFESPHPKAHGDRKKRRERIGGSAPCRLPIYMSIPNPACSTARAVSATSPSSSSRWGRPPAPSPTTA